MPVTRITNNSLATDAALNNLNAGASIAFTKPVSISGNLTVDTNTLFVDAAGDKVGIGTASSLIGKLDVAGSPTTTSSTDVLVLSRPYNPGVGFHTAASFKLSNPSSSVNNTRLDIALMRGNTVSPITPDTTVMTLLGNGNVGIGTTTPSKKLEILSTQGNGLRVNNGIVSYDISVYTDNTLRILQSGGYGSIVDATGHLTIGNSPGTGSRDLFVRRIIGTPDASGAGLSINGAASQSANYINVTSSGGTTGNIFNILSNGNVGIGTTTPSERLTVSGNISATGNITCTGHLAAATKSFKIPHQTKAGYLQYGVVESNEHSVYVRGKTSDDTITLPDHWDWLVESDSVTVTLTPYGSHQSLYIISTDNKKVVVGGVTGEYHYVVYGTRKDVEALVIETAE